jgi:hypothetical protein
VPPKRSKPPGKRAPRQHGADGAVAPEDLVVEGAGDVRAEGGQQQVRLHPVRLLEAELPGRVWRDEVRQREQPEDADREVGG